MKMYGLVNIRKNGKRYGMFPLHADKTSAEKRAEEKRLKGLTIEVKEIDVN